MKNRIVGYQESKDYEILKKKTFDENCEEAYKKIVKIHDKIKLENEYELNNPHQQSATKERNLKRNKIRKSITLVDFNRRPSLFCPTNLDIVNLNLNKNFNANPLINSNRENKEKNIKNKILNSNHNGIKKVVFEENTNYSENKPDMMFLRKDSLDFQNFTANTEANMNSSGINFNMRIPNKKKILTTKNDIENEVINNNKKFKHFKKFETSKELHNFNFDYINNNFSQTQIDNILSNKNKPKFSSKTLYRLNKDEQNEKVRNEFKNMNSKKSFHTNVNLSKIRKSNDLNKSNLSRSSLSSSSSSLSDFNSYKDKLKGIDMQIKRNNIVINYISEKTKSFTTKDMVKVNKSTFESRKENNNDNDNDNTYFNNKSNKESSYCEEYTLVSKNKKKENKKNEKKKLNYKEEGQLDNSYQFIEKINKEKSFNSSDDTETHDNNKMKRDILNFISEAKKEKSSQSKTYSKISNETSTTKKVLVSKEVPIPQRTNLKNMNPSHKMQAESTEGKLLKLKTELNVNNNDEINLNNNENAKNLLKFKVKKILQPKDHLNFLITSNTDKINNGNPLSRSIFKNKFKQNFNTEEALKEASAKEMSIKNHSSFEEEEKKSCHEKISNNNNLTINSEPNSNNTGKKISIKIPLQIKNNTKTFFESVNGIQSNYNDALQRKNNGALKDKDKIKDKSINSLSSNSARESIDSKKNEKKLNNKSGSNGHYNSLHANHENMNNKILRIVSSKIKNKIKIEMHDKNDNSTDKKLTHVSPVRQISNVKSKNNFYKTGEDNKLPNTNFNKNMNKNIISKQIYPLLKNNEDGPLSSSKKSRNTKNFINSDYKSSRKNSYSSDVYYDLKGDRYHSLSKTNKNSNQLQHSTREKSVNSEYYDSFNNKNKSYEKNSHLSTFKKENIDNFITETDTSQATYYSTSYNFKKIKTSLLESFNKISSNLENCKNSYSKKIKKEEIFMLNKDKQEMILRNPEILNLEIKKKKRYVFPDVFKKEQIKIPNKTSYKIVKFTDVCDTIGQLNDDCTYKNARFIKGKIRDHLEKTSGFDINKIFKNENKIEKISEFDHMMKKFTYNANRAKKEFMETFKDIKKKDT